MKRNTQSQAHWARVTRPGIRSLLVAAALVAAAAAVALPIASAGGISIVPSASQRAPLPPNANPPACGPPEVLCNPTFIVSGTPPVPPLFSTIPSCGTTIPVSVGEWSVYEDSTTGDSVVFAGPAYAQVKVTPTGGCQGAAIYQDVPQAQLPPNASFELSAQVMPEKTMSGPEAQSIDIIFGGIGTAVGSDRVDFSPTATTARAWGRSATAPALSYNTWNQVDLCVNANTYTSTLSVNGTPVANTPSGSAWPTSSSPTAVVVGDTSGYPVDATNFLWNDVTLTTSPSCVATPSIIFTYNGKPIPSCVACMAKTRKPGRQPIISAPAGANDFEVYWKPGRCSDGYQLPPVAVVWTYHGQYVSGDPPLAPCGARDIQIHWQSLLGTNQITKACWTNAHGWCLKKRKLPPIVLPVGGLVSSDPGGPSTAPYIDDACFELSYGRNRISKVEWTVNGKPDGKVSVPKTANDVCWYGYQATGTK